MENDDNIDEELAEIEDSKAKACRDALTAMDKAMEGWDVHYGLRVELVEFYGGEDNRTIKSRLVSERGMEG